MRLVTLDIEQLPGVDPIRVADLAPGTNFVLGPNAIGKSSLIRALHYLLADSRKSDPLALRLRAAFVDGTQRWEVERDGPNQRWLCDGETSAPPALPTADALNCYWLRAETLIAPDEDNDLALERRFRAALAGGIDLAQVRREANLQIPGFPQNQRRDWQAATKNREATENHYRHLEQQRHGRAERAERLAAAREAQASLERFGQCQQLKEAVDQRRALESHQAGFPTVLQALTGDEGEAVDGQEQAIATGREQLRDVERRRRDQKADLAATGLAESRPERGLISDARHRLEALRTAEQDRRHAAESQAVAAATLAHANEALDAPVNPPPPLKPAQIDAIGEALRGYHDARNRESHDEALGHTARRWTSGLLAVAIFSGLVVSITGAMAAAPIPLIGGFLAALTATAAGWQLRPDSASRNNARAAATAQAREALETALAEAGLEHLEYTDLGLARFLDLVRDCHRARVEHERESARVAEREETIDTQRASLERLLAPWVAAVGDDTEGLHSALDNLDARLDQARECQRRLDESERERERLQSELDDRLAARAEIYQRANLEEGDRAGLAARLETHERYVQTTRELDQARLLEQQLRTPLEPWPELVEWTLNAEAQTIASAIEQRRTTAAQLEPLSREIADLDATLEQAGGDKALTRALADEQALADSLEHHRNHYLQTQLGDWLLRDIEAEYRKRHEPGLLRDARERFEAFTHQQWSFEVDSHYQAMARDLRRDRRQPLTALSSGTRMQLLLAARVAWARDQEGNGPTLPLVLDEALTNTDARRFAAVASNLEFMARQEERQILYLTARADDLALWEASVDKAPYCIDLGALRQATDRAPAVLPAAAVPRVPSPEGRSPEAYGTLIEVPAVDPLADAGAIHIFHLLRDDLDGLHTLMDRWQLATLGPLATWLASPAGEQGSQSMAAGPSLSERVSIARAWHSLAREGRSFPVDAAVIEASAVFSSTMTQRVADQASTHNGDPVALLEALRGKAVRRLQPSLIDDFKEWLQANGYLDPRPSLDRATLTRRLLDQLGHQADPRRIQTISEWLAAGTDGLV